MSTSTATRPRSRYRPLRSPLASPGNPNFTNGLSPGDDIGRARPAELSDGRAVTLTDFHDYLRTTNNRDGRPYEAATINAYLSPAKALDTWMAAHDIDGDFTVVDTAMLNRYFREYYDAHGQGGTHTLQRNLIQLFNFLQREHGHPSAYTAALNHYAEVKVGRRRCPGSSSTICSRSPAAGKPATSRPPAITPSSVSCAAPAHVSRPAA